MNVALTKNAILAGLVVTVPCFAFLVFCSGFLPVGALAFVGVRFLRGPRDPAILFFVMPFFLEAAVYTFLLNKLAVRITRFVQRDSRRTTFLTLIFFVGCAVWLLLPINMFDCMDGHSTKRCSALRMYFGWLQKTDFGPEGTVNKCGDFGW